MGFLDLFRGGPLPRLPWVPAKPGRTALPPVRLPRDERPHDRTVEWWHYMGYVRPLQGAKKGQTTEEGDDRTSFVVTILKGQMQGLSCLVGVVILIDHAKKTHSVSTKIAPLDAAYFEPEDGRALCFHFGPRAPARRGPPEAFSVRGGMGKYTLDIDTDQQFALELSQDGPAVFLDQDGVFHYRALAPHERNALSQLEDLVQRGLGLLNEFLEEVERTGKVQDNPLRRQATEDLFKEANEIIEHYPRVLVENPDLFVTGASALASAAQALADYNKDLANEALRLRVRLERASFLPRDGGSAMNEQMAYYLWPGMVVNGTRGVGVEEKAVAGRAWMEHQWGDLPIGDYRWRYIAVIVEKEHEKPDGSVYQSKFAGQWVFFEFGPRRGGKGIRHAYHVDPEGHVRTLHGVVKFDGDSPTKDGFPLIETVELMELGSKVKIKNEGASPAAPSDAPRSIRRYKFHFKPIRNDQVCRTNLPESLMPVFWEGACEVAIEDLSSFSGDREEGTNAWAIMELAGYP